MLHTDRYYSSSLDEIDRRTRKSTNKSGDPIKLPSKILAVATSPYSKDDTIYVAESAGNVKTISALSGKVKATFSDPTAPLTSLCFTFDASKRLSIWSGCWDKTLWQFTVDNVSSDVVKPKYTTKQYRAHIDFIKCVLPVRTPDGQNLILSGGADGDLVFWDPASEKRIHILKPQSRGIEDLALDPFSTPEEPVIFFSTSQREIYHFTLPISTSLKSILLSSPIIAHETSVYKLHFDSDGDLWTASADKTAKHLVREDGWKADTTLHHPDFVRDVVVHDRGGWVVTACRDEEVRVWNRATGELYHTLSGHFEEVTGLCVVGDTVVSVSIDATVRRWSLAPKELMKAVQDATEPEKAEKETKKPQGVFTDSMLTAEEEAELREMMENEERELQELMANDEQ